MSNKLLDKWKHIYIFMHQDRIKLSFIPAPFRKITIFKGFSSFAAYIDADNNCFTSSTLYTVQRNYQFINPKFSYADTGAYRVLLLPVGINCYLLNCYTWNNEPMTKTNCIIERF